MRDLLKGSIILASSNLLVRVAGHIYRILMGRMLTPYEFGLLNLALPLQYLILVLTSAGVAPSVAKFVAEQEAKGDFKRRDSIISSSLVFFTLLGFLLGFLFYALASPIGVYVFHDLNVILPLKVSSIALGFGFLVAAYTGVFQGYKRMDYMGLTLVLEQVLRIVFAFALVYSGFSVIGAIWGSTLGFVVAVPIAYLLFKRIGQRFSNCSIRDFEEVFRFSLPVSATALAGFTLAYADVLLLGVYLTPEEVGIYSAASPTSRLILAFTTAIYATLLPSISELKAKKKVGEIKRYIVYAYKMAFAVLLPVVAFSILFSSTIISLLFGSAYIMASASFKVLIVGAAFFGIFMVNSGIFQGLGKPVVPLRILAFAAVFDIFLNIMLIPRYQILGAAYATSISFVFAGITSTLILRATLWKYI
ncbi:MAG: flippase [Candidatus Hydrothermarchaeales archaeon]